MLRFVMMYGVMVIILMWSAYFEYRYKIELANDDSIWQFSMIFFVVDIDGVWHYKCIVHDGKNENKNKSAFRVDDSSYLVREILLALGYFYCRFSDCFFDRFPVWPTIPVYWSIRSSIPS